MNKKTQYLFTGTLSLFIVFFLTLFYIFKIDSYTSTILKQKSDFISIVGLPDLAISTEAGYIRHRSLSDTKSIFIDGCEHLEYFSSTFAINHNQGNK